jgi:pilus assembly protein CpaB
MRMNTARIVVLTIAIGAGGVAAYLASGMDRGPPPPAVVQLPTVDVLIAKSDIGLGKTVTAGDLQWQTWPETTASSSFIRRSERPDAVTQIVGLIARAPFIGGEPIRELKLVKPYDYAKLITIYRGLEREEWSCHPDCEAVALPRR